MDPPHGRAARHDRAVRARPGARSRRRPAHRQLRHQQLRLRHPLRARVQGLHQHLQHGGRPEELRREELRRHRGRRLHHPAQQLRAGAHAGVLPHPAQRADHLPGQEHLCALRHHRQRHAVRARVGRLRDAGVQQHHAAAGQDLRRRGLRAGAVLRERRGLRDQLQGPRRQVPGPARRDACPRPERRLAPLRSAAAPPGWASRLPTLGRTQQESAHEVGRPGPEQQRRGPARQRRAAAVSAACRSAARASASARSPSRWWPAGCSASTR